MLNDIINSYNQYIIQITDGGETIASLLRTERYEEAYSLILGLAEGLDWMKQVAMKLEESEIPVKFDIEKNAQHLRAINDGLEKEDFVLVADIFEYEVDPFLKSLQPIEYNEVG